MESRINNNIKFLILSFIVTLSLFLSGIAYRNLLPLELFFTGLVITLLVLIYSINESYKNSLRTSALKIFEPEANDKILIFFRTFINPILFYSSVVLFLTRFEETTFIILFINLVITFYILRNIHLLFQKYSTSEFYELFIFDVTKIISLSLVSTVLIVAPKNNTFERIFYSLFFIFIFFIFLSSFRKIYQKYSKVLILKLGSLSVLNGLIFYYLSGKSIINPISFIIFLSASIIISSLLTSNFLKAEKTSMRRIIGYVILYIVTILLVLET